MCKDMLTGKVSAQIEAERHILAKSDFSVSRDAATIVFQTSATGEGSLRHAATKKPVGMHTELTPT
jgi:hypothetical protein